MRSQDKPVLDAALAIAKIEGTDITTIVRNALAEFVKTKARTEGRKMDEFLDGSVISNPISNRVLTPDVLRRWPERDLLDAAKVVRARKEELDSELRRRGYYFRW
jgi:hypothetical protein